MLRNTTVSLAAAAFFGGVLQTQVATADDDIWDLMNPGWWIDQMDDDDDDYWRYRRYGAGPYAYGGPYGWGYPPPYYAQSMQTAKKKKQPAPRLPE